jgi:hypothetical protein
MRLVTFVHKDTLHIGALRTGDGPAAVIDLNRADPSLPSDMTALLRGGPAALEKASAALNGAGPADA